MAISLSTAIESIVNDPIVRDAILDGHSSKYTVFFAHENSTAVWEEMMDRVFDEIEGDDTVDQHPQPLEKQDNPAQKRQTHLTVSKGLGRCLVSI